MNFRLITCAFLAATALSGCNSIAGTGVEKPSISADELGFSKTNMNVQTDPSIDFYDYAAGGWDRRIQLPEGEIRTGFLTIMNKRLNEQLAVVVKEAAETSDSATEGSAERQIGTLYNSFMDLERRNTARAAPLRDELDRLQAVANNEEMSRYLGRFSTLTNQWPILTVEVFGDLSDSSRNATYLRPGGAGLRLDPIFALPADAEPKQIYVRYIASLLEKAGYEPTEAKRIGTTSVAIESDLHLGKMAPELKNDIRNLNNPRSRSEIENETGEFSVEAFFGGLGAEVPDTIILTDPDYSKALASLFETYSLEDIKGYLAYRMVQGFSGLLSEDFAEPANTLNKELLGLTIDTPMEEQALGFIKATLGQPLGQLYVRATYTEEERAQTLDMIERIKSAFRERIVENEWLSNPTRKEALKKLDAFTYFVGYPDEWIDYSSIEVGDDPVANAMAASAFEVKRLLDRQGKPVVRRPFSDKSHTLPTIINAAYNPSFNGFEVTAAIAQPPANQSEMDAPVRFCRLGAIIGHEMTHGFDSGGRAFDSTGTLRDWWTPNDSAYFEKEAAKLVDQANGFEAAPGKFINGALTVKENMADIGGLTFAYEALQDYLAENPDENVEIDGMTPDQRCFVAYTQLWAEKATEAAIEQSLSDVHSPNRYRAFAPLQHLDAFYSAFGIEEGDPMWLPPEKRIKVW